MDTGHRSRARSVVHGPQNRGIPKGAAHPFGTQPCLQGVVCYTCRRGWRGKRGRCFMPPLATAGKWAGFLRMGMSKKPDRFHSAAAGIRPPAQPHVTDWPKKTRNGVRRASTLALARLTGRKAKLGGVVNGGAKRRSSRPLTVPPGFATRHFPMISCSTLLMLCQKLTILPSPIVIDTCSLSSQVTIYRR